MSPDTLLGKETAKGFLDDISEPMAAVVSGVAVDVLKTYRAKK